MSRDFIHLVMFPVLIAVMAIGSGVYICWKYDEKKIDYIAKKVMETKCKQK